MSATIRFRFWPRTLRNPVCCEFCAQCGQLGTEPAATSATAVHVTATRHPAAIDQRFMVHPSYMRPEITHKARAAQGRLHNESIMIGKRTIDGTEKVDRDRSWQFQVDDDRHDARVRVYGLERMDAQYTLMDAQVHAPAGHDHAHDHAGHRHGHAGHSHGVNADADARYLTIAFALIVGFMVLEVVVGILAR